MNIGECAKIVFDKTPETLYAKNSSFKSFKYGHSEKLLIKIKRYAVFRCNHAVMAPPRIIEASVSSGSIFGETP